MLHGECVQWAYACTCVYSVYVYKHINIYALHGASLVAQMVKNLPAVQETWVQSLGREIPCERAWQPTPVFLPGESPWTEEPGRIQSMGLQRVGHN